MSTIRLEVVTPTRTVLSRDVEMVIARTVEGDIGVMAGHIPLVTVLQPGIMRLRDEAEGDNKVAISGGFLEVSPDNKVTVLAQTAELASEIDVERARRAAGRARERLSNRGDREIDLARAEIALRRAMVRLETAGADQEK